MCLLWHHIEIIPSFESKTAQVIVVTALLKVPIAGVAEQKLSRSDGTIALTKPPKEIPGIFLWNLFIVMVPTFLILAIAYSLRGMLIPREPVASSGTSVGSGINSDEETSSFFQLLRVNWALFSHEFDLIEIWIGFLAWSSTNLFIRRLLNPEIGTTAFEKYGCDSIFGGMSAAVTVLLKAVLKKSLRDMQQQQV